MSKCIFCAIVAKQLSTNIVAETEKYLVFNDINPRASYHVLIIPKKHHPDFRSSLEDYVGAVQLAHTLAKKNNLWPYALRANFGAPYQSVFHSHLHLIGEANKN